MEIEENIKKVRAIEKQQRLKRRSGGSLSKGQIEAMRDEEERFQDQSDKRKELARKKAMESLGFDYEGDYKEILQDIKKETGQVDPYYVSKS